MSLQTLGGAFVVDEQWEKFTQTDHNTWQHLFERQSKLLKSRAADEVLTGLNELGICSHQIPKLTDLNKLLKQKTGFTVVPVTGLIPADLFFQFLSERKFPSGCFIRKPENMDYLEEPDIFHDVFGHVPLLADPVFADFIELYGHKGLEAMEQGALKLAETLYWFTVEFGLIQTSAGLRIFGAGITSSKGETIYSLDSDVPARIKFNPFRVMKTEYHIDAFQKTYFVIESFEQLFKALDNLDWQQLQNVSELLPAIAQGVIVHPQEEFLFGATK